MDLRERPPIIRKSIAQQMAEKCEMDEAIGRAADTYRMTLLGSLSRPESGPGSADRENSEEGSDG